MQYINKIQNERLIILVDDLDAIVILKTKKNHEARVRKEARVPKEGGQVDPNKENQMAARGT